MVKVLHAAIIILISMIISIAIIMICEHWNRPDYLIHPSDIAYIYKYDLKTIKDNKLINSQYSIMMEVACRDDQDEYLASNQVMEEFDNALDRDKRFEELAKLVHDNIEIED